MATSETTGTLGHVVSLGISRFGVAPLVATWLVLVAAASSVLWKYQLTPGDAQATPAHWPSASRIPRPTDRATLVLLAHPKCTCTRATIAELSRLMSRAQGSLAAFVLFLSPTDFPDDWDRSETWRTASRIPGVHVLSDRDGVEARRFGATTSGTAAVYDRAGALVFRGGLTIARGHEGESPALGRILAGISAPIRRAGAPVFGCPIFEGGTR
jgi:hypothetical protein